MDKIDDRRGRTRLFPPEVSFMKSIKIQESTKATLDKLKLVTCETYNSVIERLIKENGQRIRKRSVKKPGGR
jgi:hypothetical protein